MDTAIEILSVLFLTMILATVLGVLIAWPVMVLWNWLMPEIFGLTTLTFWQALGIAGLAKLLFGSVSTSSSS